MSWVDQLQQAKFRGVDFWADTSVDWIGRDKIVRTYPFKDAPTLQDVGAVSEPGTFSAYVFGDDAFTLRDKLIAALNQPGPGDLMHPWLGPMSVEIIGKIAVRHSTLEGGVVRFDINFIKTGAAIYPKATDNTARNTGDKVSTARNALVQHFSSKFSFENLAGWARDHGLGTITSALNAINGTVNKLLTKPEGFLQFETEFRLFNNSLRDEVNAPETLALGIINTMEGLASLGDGFTDALQRQEDLFSWDSGYTPSPFSTPTRLQEAQNDAAVVTLVQAGALLAAAETICNTDFTTTWNYVDAMAWRAKMNAQFQLVLANIDDNDTFTAFLYAMSSLSNDIVTRSNFLGRVTTYSTPPVEVPAMLVSYQAYDDIEWDDEIVQNNNIVHPLFIPAATTLELISHD